MNRSSFLSIPAFILSLFLIFFSVAPSSSLQAQAQLRSEAENYTASRTTEPGDWLAGRVRLRNTALFNHHSFRFSTEFDLYTLYDEPIRGGFTLKELYADLFLPAIDIRAGRQKLIAGTMDGVTIADILSPTDLNQIVFLNSDDLRVALDAISFTYYLGSNSIQFITALYRPPSVLPDSDSRWSPFSSGDQQADLSLIRASNNSFSDDLVYSLSYQSRGRVADFSLSLMHWAYPVPAFGIEPGPLFPQQAPQLSLIENRENSLMGSATFSSQITPSLRLNAETLYVNRRAFTWLPFSEELLQEAQTDPLAALQLFNQFQSREDLYLMESPWWSAGAGFRFDISNLTAEVQLVADWIVRYAPEMVQERLFPYATLLLSRSFMDERLTVGSFSRYHYTGRDFWSQLELRYEAGDKLELSGGLSLFGGRDADLLYGHLSFSQYRQNSFFFTRVRYFL